MLKRSLLDIVDLEKIPNLRSIPTLGEIIGNLNQILKEDFFKNFIDKELRNALGHDNWWIENRLIFCYRTKKPEPKKLTSEQFTDVVTKHSSFTSELYGAYSQNYCAKK